MTTLWKFVTVLKLSYTIPKAWPPSLQIVEFTKAFLRKGFSHLCKHFIFSGVCRNLILLGVKKCAFSQYNSSRCLILADFKTEYDLPGEVQLHQYFDEASWLFIEAKLAAQKPNTDF